MHQAVDEAGAGRVEVARAAVDAERVLHVGRGRRHLLVGGGGGEQDQVDVGADRRRRVSIAARPASIASPAVVPPIAALLDAGALGDPLVAGVEAGLEVGVGDDLGRAARCPSR